MNIPLNYLFEKQSLLEAIGASHRSLEHFMANEISLDWEDSEVYTELYNLLKATMYFDSNIGRWIDKDIC